MNYERKDCEQCNVGVILEDGTCDNKDCPSNKWLKDLQIKNKKWDGRI